MSKPIIQVEHLSKSYRIQHDSRERYTSLRDVLTKNVRQLFDRSKRKALSQTFEDFSALSDVSFNVECGDIVGIIGRNGAGKSTLLKILSRITEPTDGRVTLRGRIASLLEVGTGFHPELTGRENIYLNGAILGMKRSEIDRKFDEIVDFAGVERFLDTPVKRYSSGMYVRLAFAIAAHLEPEILVIDEVLAVGDAAFQKKCLGKMNDVANSGKTVIFVSHNMGIVQSLCVKGLLLSEGQVQLFGPISDVISQYTCSNETASTFHRGETSNKAVYLSDATFQVLEAEEGVFLKSDLVVYSTIARKVSIDLRLFDIVGIPVGFAPIGSFCHDQEIQLSAGQNVIRSSHEIGVLSNGTYRVSIDVADPTFDYHDRVEQAISFELSIPPQAGCYRRLIQQWGFGSIQFPMMTASQELLSESDQLKL